MSGESQILFQADHSQRYNTRRLFRPKFQMYLQSWDLLVGLFLEQIETLYIVYYF